MIQLLTGLPGSGKSLSLIGIIRGFVEKGREVFVYGINGLDYEALGCRPWDKPFSQWQSLPDGSVLVWDEPQFSELGVPDNKFAPPPDWMKQLTMHRHHGLDFVLATQRPTYLHSFVRGLVGLHMHLLRQFGLDQAKRFEWNEVQPDPTKNRKRAVEATFSFPKDDYKFYKSAEIHTVQKRIPKRLIYAALSLVLAIVLGVVGWRYASSIGHAAPVEVKKSVAEKSKGLLDDVMGGEPKHHVLTKEEYLKQLVPRIEGMPWSAPIFDKREAVAEPEIYCVDIVDEGRCQCYTEQVTKLKVDDAFCAKIAKDGIYNPFRKPRRDFVDQTLARNGANVQQEAVQPGFFPIRQVGNVGGDKVDAPAAPSVSGHRPLDAPYDPSVFLPKSSQY